MSLISLSSEPSSAVRQSTMRQNRSMYWTLIKSINQSIREELKVDSVTTMMKKGACKFVYKGFFNLGPEALNSMFNLHVTERDLRSSDQLKSVVPKCRTQFASKNFAVRDSNHWNILPYDIQSAPSPDSFKE